MPLLLRESDIRQLLPMGALIDLMETALAEFSAGRVDQPVRSVVDIGAGQGFFGTMPAYLPSGPAAGAKLVTVFNSNVAKGLPSHYATILLLDTETGALMALLDGRFITEARTAAVSAVSARYLARKNSRVLAILGSGVQAHSHYEALMHVFSFEEVHAYSPNRANLEAFCAHSTGGKARPCHSVLDAVAGADVIVTASNATEPILRSEWIADGAHIIAVGACRPTHRELTGELVARASLYVDSRAAALKESGDILLAIAEGQITRDHIRGELGERPSRASEHECTLFKSLGLAVEDVATAHLVYGKAVAAGIGTTISL